MSVEQVRIAIATVLDTIETDWLAAKGKSLVIETDNRKFVDQATQSDPYLQVQIIHMSADQADLADNPRVRHDGQILLSVVCKEGSGTSASNILLDFIRPYFELAKIGIIQCNAFEPKLGKPKAGWWYSPAIVNFWYYTTVS